jgi:hypothetical protein
VEAPLTLRDLFPGYIKKKKKNKSQTGEVTCSKHTAYLRLSGS